MNDWIWIVGIVVFMVGAGYFVATGSPADGRGDYR